MDATAHALLAAHELYIRANTTAAADTTTAAAESRPPVYKAIGISLAIASGCFIGVSFVLKKIGLLKANEKYDEVAGEGYGYLKNAYWWTGMTLMIIGEICNFVAYAFVDAILVTPLGALSVVITTILSAIFLKERLSMVGKVGCFLCIVGSVVIVMNAPAESSAATIQEMKGFIIAPGFLSYAGVVIVGCVSIVFFVAPKYGKKSMLVYLTICSLIGGLSVVATQGLGAAVVAQIHGAPYPSQFKEWFLYVLFVFVITTLVTEIIFLNKALNLFNAALVTPTYYVYFTSSTIITSAILFRGFKGSPTSIITVVMGFFVICAGVVLLQLSKSAKDVPDAAVFSGDLDQVRTIAEQEQPESEPKADAIRGAAAIVRRFSVARQKMEAEEARRLHEEKMADLEPIGENEHIEWDGLRRRRTTIGGRSMRGSTIIPPVPTTPTQYQHSHPSTGTPAHPPLGMSRFPTEAELAEDANHPNTPFSANFLGSIRGRRRSTLLPGTRDSHVQSPMHPVPLTEITIPSSKGDPSSSSSGGGGGYFPSHPAYGAQHDDNDNLSRQKTEYEGAGDAGHHIHFTQSTDDRDQLASRGSTIGGGVGPTPPPHSARRQFSFHNVFRKLQSPGSPSTSAAQAHVQHEDAIPELPLPPSKRNLGSRQGSSHSSATKGATEEERLGLVKGDTNESGNYDDDEDDVGGDGFAYEDKRPEHLPSAVGSSTSVGGRVVAGRGSPPRIGGGGGGGGGDRSGRSGSDKDEYDEYEPQRRDFQNRRVGERWDSGEGRNGGGGAFI